jgi:adenylyltransferase/sulfurtransferase
VIGKPRIPDFGVYLQTMNRFVQVEAIDHEPDDDEALELARRCDIILSCPPGFEERMRLNRAAVAAGVPLIDAAQWGMTGTLLVASPGKTACLECVYPEPPPFEELFPVVGAISSAMGSLAALEAIKVLSGIGKPLWGKMLTYDGNQGRTATVTLARREDCPCCGVNPHGS